MKKVLSLILIFLYLIVNANTVLASRTCAGKSFGIARILKPSLCKTCKKEKRKGCCKDKSEIVKVVDQHTKISQFQTDIKLVFVLEPVLMIKYHFPAILLNPYSLQSFFNNIDDPIINDCSIHIFNCQFLI